MTDTDPPPASRFVAWFALAAFNTIALVALNSELENDLKHETSENKWCISSMIITLTLSILGVFAHVLKGKFVGTPMEGGLVFLTLGFWCSVLPTMMKPSHDIAQNPAGEIENANLYFFSWGAFIMALSIFVAFLRDVHSIGKSLKNKSFKAFAGAALMAASFVTMASAIRLYKSRNCDDDKDDDDFCDRTVFAISIGVVSGCVAFIWMICGTRLPAIADVILGWLMLIAWIFAVGYITFGDDDASPAKNIGNLYFVTWTGFIISCLVASSSLRAMFVTVGFGGGGDEGESTTEEAKPERAADEENVLAVDEEKVSSEDAPVDDEVAVNR